MDFDEDGDGDDDDYGDGPVITFNLHSNAEPLEYHNDFFSSTIGTILTLDTLGDLVDADFTPNERAQIIQHLHDLPDPNCFYDLTESQLREIFELAEGFTEENRNDIINTLYSKHWIVLAYPEDDGEVNPAI